jgi:nicotinate-nucleotide pyrophosphorylase (carboxylating)
VSGRAEATTGAWLPASSAAAQLRAVGLDAEAVRTLVAHALAEDCPSGVDVTSVATVPSDQLGVADLVARDEGVLAGVAVAALVFAEAAGLASDTHYRMVRRDGDNVRPGDTVLSVSGRVRDLLLAERTALNLVCHLSGVATATSAWVDEIAGTAARVRDTRKTTPGLRTLEKYAVRCGGGVNHRLGLHDAALVKDNHVAAAGSVVDAYRAVREAFPEVDVQVEVDTVAQARDVVAAGCRDILVDNFTLQQMREVVDLVGGLATIEASGGLTLSDARAVADTGVDLIAVGALTHSAPVLDIGLDLREAG